MNAIGDENRMDKKIVGIVGSYRKGRVIDTAVSEILKGAESAGVETLDPYFNIDIDVYYSDGIPDLDDRKERLGDPAGFETAFHQTLDRFFVQKLPVTLTYKQTERIDIVLQRVVDGAWAFRNETTNLLYRIQHGQVLH